MYKIDDLHGRYISMRTEFISLQECRKSMSSLWKKANKENIKYIVMVHSNPVLEITPIRQHEMQVETISPEEKKEMENMIKDRKAGKKENFLSLEELKQKYKDELSDTRHKKSGKVLGRPFRTKKKVLAKSRHLVD